MHLFDTFFFIAVRRIPLPPQHPPAIPPPPSLRKIVKSTSSLLRRLPHKRDRDPQVSTPATTLVYPELQTLGEKDVMMDLGIFYRHPRATGAGITLGAGGVEHA